MSLINPHRFGGETPPEPTFCSYPPEIDVADFNWGLDTQYPVTPGAVSVINEGDTFLSNVIEPNIRMTNGIPTNAEYTFISPTSTDTNRFAGWYSKHQVFNADDTIIKQRSADAAGSSGSRKTVFVPVATKNDPNTFVYTNSIPFNKWSNVTPNRLFSLSNSDQSFRMWDIDILTPTYTDTVLFDFTSEYTGMSWNNESNMSAADTYVTLVGSRISDGQAVAVTLDVQDCIANPNQPSNVWSVLEIEATGDPIIDWVSPSQTGLYIVVAYFGDFTRNPKTGNSIIVYDNTGNNLGTGVPTITANSMLNSDGIPVPGCVYLNESHADLGVDIFDEDVYVGFKNNGYYSNQGSGPYVDCVSDGETDIGGCMGYDNNTFMVMVRLRDGLTVYKFSDPFPPTRGFYGGYVSCRNTSRPGWAYITEDCCARDNAPSTDLFTIKLDYTSDIMEYYGRSYSDRNWSSPGGTLNTSAQGCASRDGTMIQFQSYFNNTGIYANHAVFDGNGPTWILEYLPREC
jgi:hypothetical protein